MAGVGSSRASVRVDVLDMPRPVIAAATIAAALGGPYVATETEVGRRFWQSSATVPASNGASGPDYSIHAHHQVERLRPSDPAAYRYDQATAVKLGGMTGEAIPDLTGADVRDLREILRFDVSPDWVMSRFARVTTVLADTRLEGLRVPVVTGIRANDIAGTMTYFFDRGGQVQRIMLHGFTGDPSRIVEAMTTHYGLSRNPSLEAGVYTRAWNGSAVHFLRLSHAPVVYSDAVHQKYTVFLELNQPSLAYGTSEEARRVISSDRGALRW